MKALSRPLRGSLLMAACLCVLWGAAPAYAKKAAPQASKAQTLAPASPAASGGKGPIDISADESLEWYQDKGLYVARGKAKAVQGDSTIEADILTAHQRAKDASAPKAKKQDGEAGLGGDLDYMTAEGNVRISDPKQQVFGQKAVYDLDKKVVKITGSNLKYVTDKDVVTARDSLEYFEDRDMAVARGRAVALHQGSRIEADVLAANFAPAQDGAAQAGGGKELSEIRAKGNVIIVTKDGGVSRGDWATYDAKRDTAVLHDHVRITRGDTQLSGDTAEVDFATGQSRLLNRGSGRVRALLPGSSDKDKSGKAQK